MLGFGPVSGASVSGLPDDSHVTLPIDGDKVHGSIIQVVSFVAVSLFNDCIVFPTT